MNEEKVITFQELNKGLNEKVNSKDNELFNRINLRSEEKDIDLNYDLVEKSNKLFEFIGKTVENKNVLVFDITKISSKEIISKLEELEELSA